jgi:hypothetical protein
MQGMHRVQQEMMAEIRQKCRTGLVRSNRTLSYTSMRWQTDCARRGNRLFLLGSEEIMRKHLVPERRLDILRAGDGLRKWHSLDDKRVCILCERIFTGRQIDISCDQRGRYLLKCPTNGCASIAAHWFYLGNAAAAAAHILHDGRQATEQRINGSAGDFMTSRSDEDCLEALRAADDWRQWHSLDDERLCIECAQLITGRQIVVTGDSDGHISLHCPTGGCGSTPRDWFYHGKRGARGVANIIREDPPA